MKTCKILGHKTEITINSDQELENFLVDIKNSCVFPYPAFDMLHENGNALILGITKEQGHVYYMEKDSDCYYASLSVNEDTYSGYNDLSHTQEILEEETLDFFYFGHLSQLPVRSLIPFEDAVKVAKKFLEMGVRPQSLIKWEVHHG